MDNLIAEYHFCKNRGCASAIPLNSDYCPGCVEQLTEYERDATLSGQFENGIASNSMSSRYPKYYKDVSQYSEVDVYAVHKLFNVDDPSGAIQHASKKLLLSGVRTGGKSKWEDIKEARDTLNRWLELNQVH